MPSPLPHSLAPMSRPVVALPTTVGALTRERPRRRLHDFLPPPAKRSCLEHGGSGGGTALSGLVKDLQQHALSFSTPQELCRVHAVSRSFGSVASKDELWKALATNGSMISPEHVEPAMSQLGLSTYHQLVETLTRVGIPAGVLGYWKGKTQRLAKGDSEAYDSGARGELLCISITTGGFLCESIEPDGSRSKIFRTRIAVRSKGLSVIVHSLESEFCLGGARSRTGLAQSSGHKVPSAAGRGIAIRRMGRSFIMSRGGRVQTYAKLAAPAWAPPPASLLVPAGHLPQDLGALHGLWSALYGNHGREIVDVTLEGRASAAAAEPFSAVGWPRCDGGAAGSPEGAAASAPGSSCILRGTKIIGDACVPAGQCSFAVDMSRAYGPGERLGNAGPRLVASFLPGGAVIYDLHAHRPNVAGWYRGWGQVNHTPGTWSPSWVSVDLLVYRGGSTAFSVLWSEVEGVEAAPVRVIIDFQRLPGCGGP